MTYQRKRCDKGECIRRDLEHALIKVREAAIDGLGGSQSYAIILIHGLRTR